MSQKTTYVTLRESEKQSLDDYIEQEWGENRITKGGAIKYLAEKEINA